MYVPKSYLLASEQKIAKISWVKESRIQPRTWSHKVHSYSESYRYRSSGIKQNTIFVFFLLVLHATASDLIIEAHGRNVSVRILLLSGEPCYRQKAPLVVGETWTQVERILLTSCVQFTTCFHANTESCVKMFDHFYILDKSILITYIAPILISYLQFDIRQSSDEIKINCNTDICNTYWNENVCMREII